MEPVEWIVGGIILLVAALSSSGCSDDNDRHPVADGGDEPNGGDAPPYVPPDAGPKTPDAGVDGGVICPDPRPRTGANGEFSNPADAFQPCQIVDLDISGDRITGMCGPSINRMFTVDVDLASPLTPRPSLMGVGSPTILVGTPGKIRPAQVMELPGGSVIPFSADEAPLVCGLSFVAPGGGVTTRLVDPIGGVQPYGLQSAVVADDVMAGTRLFVPAWNAAGDDAAELLSYGITPGGALDQHDPGSIIGLPGQMPVSIAKLDATTAAVVRLDGADGPAIDLVDLSGADPTHRIIGTIPLPRVPLPLPELNVSEDGMKAILLTEDSYLLTVDLVGLQVEGEVALGGAPRDVTLKGSMAYVSNENAVQLVDLTDSTTPSIVQSIGQMYDLGPIAVHSSGTIFVAATARWWEGADAATACLVNDPAALCRTHIIAIDPDQVQPWTQPECTPAGDDADGG